MFWQHLPQLFVSIIFAKFAYILQVAVRAIQGAHGL